MLIIMYGGQPGRGGGGGGGGLGGGGIDWCLRLKFKCPKCERAQTRERAEKIKDTGTLEKKRTVTQPMAFCIAGGVFIRIPLLSPLAPD